MLFVYFSLCKALQEDNKYLFNFSIKFVVDLYLIAYIFHSVESEYFEFIQLAGCFQSIVAITYSIQINNVKINLKENFLKEFCC